MTEAVVQSVLSMKLSKEKISRYEEIRNKILEVPKFGNDIPEVDYFARDVAYTYSRPLQKGLSSSIATQEEAASMQVFILYLPMFRWEDRQELPRTADMPIHRLLTEFHHLQARM